MSSRGCPQKRNVTGTTEAKRRRRSSTPEPSERVVLPSVTDGSTQGITVKGQFGFKDGGALSILIIYLNITAGLNLSRIKINVF